MAWMFSYVPAGWRTSSRITHVDAYFSTSMVGKVHYGESQSNFLQTVENHDQNRYHQVSWLCYFNDPERGITGITINPTTWCEPLQYMMPTILWLMKSHAILPQRTTVGVSISPTYQLTEDGGRQVVLGRSWWWVFLEYLLVYCFWFVWWYHLLFVFVASIKCTKRPGLPYDIIGGREVP